MDKEILSQIINRIIKCIIITICIYIILFLLPIDKPTGNIELCLYKNITGKECFNCGMTRAVLSVLHFNFNQAFEYNHNVIIVFPMILVLYIHKWYIYIKNGGRKI